MMAMLSEELTQLTRSCLALRLCTHSTRACTSGDKLVMNQVERARASNHVLQQSAFFCTHILSARSAYAILLARPVQSLPMLPYAA